MKKLLYYGDSPTAPTGFGNVARHVLSRVADKYDITALGINEFHQSWPSFPCRLIPAYINERDPYGRKRFIELVKKECFDVWFLQYDIHFWAFLPDLVNVVRSMGRDPHIFLHCVIDSPVNPMDIHNLSVADVIGVPSRWGIQEILKIDPAINYKLRYIPFGVDMGEFYPLSDYEIHEKRMQVGISDEHFLIANVNHNAARKDIPRTLMYHSYLRQKRPNTILYLHMQAQEEINKGHDLFRVINANRDWMKNVTFANDFDASTAHPVERLNIVYNCANLIVSTSLGEGFGLPTLEAMAVKTPVLVPDNSSLSELVADGRGTPIKCGSNLTEWTILTHDPGFKRPLTNIEDMIAKTEAIMDNPSLVELQVERAYKWVKEEMNWNIIIKAFADAMEENPLCGNKYTSLEGGVRV